MQFCSIIGHRKQAARAAAFHQMSFVTKLDRVVGHARSNVLLVLVHMYFTVLVYSTRTVERAYFSCKETADKIELFVVVVAYLS